jgi:hypothetical protein
MASLKRALQKYSTDSGDSLQDYGREYSVLPKNE